MTVLLEAEQLAGALYKINSGTAMVVEQLQNRSRKIQTSTGMPAAQQQHQQLLQFPVTKHILWDHTSMGNPAQLHLAYYRCPRVRISSKVLRLAHRHLENSAASSFDSVLVGSVTLDQDGQGVSVTLDHLDKVGTNEGLSMQTPGDIVVPFQVCRNQKSPPTSNDHDYLSALKLVYHRACSKDAVHLSSLLITKGHCLYRLHGDSITCSVELDSVTLATRVKVTPINPIPIVPTALSKNLAGPLSLSQLQGEPKSGYMTMDHTRKLLLVLESDPKVCSLPVVGIWISGVPYIYSPFVWACCMRYLNNNSLQDRVCLPPEPFLIVLYSPVHSKPEFYECTTVTGSNEPEFSLYSGQETIHISKTSSSSDAPCADLQLVLVESGRKAEGFEAAITQINQSIHKPVSKDDSDVPNRPPFMLDDITPRAFPMPHPAAKAPTAQAMVPEVSLFCGDFEFGVENMKNRQSANVIQSNYAHAESRNSMQTLSSLQNGNIHIAQQQHPQTTQQLLVSNTLSNHVSWNQQHPNTQARNMSSSNLLNAPGIRHSNTQNISQPALEHQLLQHQYQVQRSVAPQQFARSAFPQPHQSSQYTTQYSHPPQRQNQLRKPLIDKPPANGQIPRQRPPQPGQAQDNPGQSGRRKLPDPLSLPNQSGGPAHPRSRSRPKSALPRLNPDQDSDRMVRPDVASINTNGSTRPQFSNGSQITVQSQPGDRAQQYVSLYESNIPPPSGHSVALSRPLATRPSSAGFRYPQSQDFCPAPQQQHFTVAQQQTFPVPQQQNYQVPQQQNYQVPQQQNYPVPQQQNYPVPQQQNYPVPQQQNYQVPQQQNFPVPQQQNDPVPQQKNYPVPAQQNYPVPQQQAFPIAEQQNFPVPQQQNFPVSQQQSNVPVLQHTYFPAPQQRCSVASTQISLNNSHPGATCAHQCSGHNNQPQQDLHAYPSVPVTDPSACIRSPAHGIDTAVSPQLLQRSLPATDVSPSDNSCRSSHDSGLSVTPEKTPGSVPAAATTLESSSLQEQQSQASGQQTLQTMSDLAALQSMDRVPPEVYQLLVHQDNQLRQLQAQIQQLLEKQNASISSPSCAKTEAQTCHKNMASVATSPQRASISVATSPVKQDSSSSGRPPTAKTCSVAVNTSSFQEEHLKSLQCSPSKQRLPTYIHTPPSSTARHSAQLFDQSLSTHPDYAHSGRKINATSTPTDATKQHTFMPPPPTSLGLSHDHMDDGMSTCDLTRVMNEVALETATEKTDESIHSDMIVDMPSYSSSPTQSHDSRTNYSGHSPVSVSMMTNQAEINESDNEDGEEAAHNKDNMPMTEEQQKLYYDQLLINVHKLLNKQSPEATSLAAEQSTNGEMMHNYTIEDSYAHSAWEQTRLKYLGSDNSMLPADTTFIPQINYMSMMLDSDNDVSMEINAMAMKYLKDDQLTQLARLKIGAAAMAGLNGVGAGKHSGLLRQVLSMDKSGTPNVTTYGMSPNNMSMATKRYMEKHGLVNASSNATMTDSPLHSNTSLKCSNQTDLFESYLDVMDSTEKLQRSPVKMHHQSNKSIPQHKYPGHTSSAPQSPIIDHERAAPRITTKHPSLDCLNSPKQQMPSKATQQNENAYRSQSSASGDSGRYPVRRQSQESSKDELVLDIAKLRQMPKLL